jgi:hypothetical protein
VRVREVEPGGSFDPEAALGIRAHAKALRQDRSECSAAGLWVRCLGAPQIGELAINRLPQSPDLDQVLCGSDLLLEALSLLLERAERTGDVLRCLAEE